MMMLIHSFSVRYCIKYPLLLLLLSWSVFTVVLISMKTKSNIKSDWLKFRHERYFAYQNRGPQTGPGEDGEPVTLALEEKGLADELWKNASFNVLASAKIALDRGIPDNRREG